MMSGNLRSYEQGLLKRSSTDPFTNGPVRLRHQPARAVSHAPACSASRSNSPSRTPAVKAAHSDGVKTRTGPSCCLLSRSATWPSASGATSTQADAPLQYLLTRQAALVVSVYI